MILRLQVILLNLCLLCLVCACSDDDTQVIDGEIIGEWRVSAIHDSSPSGPTLGPGAGEVIAIDFQADGRLAGSTSVNTFKGTFLADESKLTITGLTTTEVGETNFGNAFYRALNESFNPNTGFSEFNISFQSENSVNLEYQGFKFLTLQK